MVINGKTAEMKRTIVQKRRAERSVMTLKINLKTLGTERYINSLYRFLKKSPPTPSLTKEGEYL